MKKILKCLVVAICTITFVGCRQGNVPLSQTRLDMHGIITNEEGTPLKAIQVCVDTIASNFNSEEWWWSPIAISEQDGQYYLHYTRKYDWLTTKDWSTEITLIAKDTTGVYATQTKTFPIVVHKRVDYEQGGRTNATVTADFVMKKK